MFPHWSDKDSFIKVKDNKIETINLEQPNKLRNNFCSKPIALSSNINATTNQVFVVLKNKNCGTIGLKTKKF